MKIFFQALFGRTGAIKWIIGARNNRQIGIDIGGELVTGNIFQLSTGQAVLLDLFLSIIRDFDLGEYKLTKLGDIRGIVVVDEIDLHLHTDLQHDLLPKLIQLFPNVQFIITTHSPLFLIGMEKTFSSNGFQLIELPNCYEIEVERFSEFDAAYKHMRESVRFQDDVQKIVDSSHKPVLYLEGTTDIDYVRKAGVLLGKSELVDQFKLVDAGGSPYLDKLWSAYKSHLGDTIQQKMLLLYDCDAGKPNDNSGKLFRRTIALQPNKIKTGIENLFDDRVIEKAIDHKPAFVDITHGHRAIERGVEVDIPTSWKVNKAEKRNLCSWLCENGTAEDFERFSEIFNILEEVVTFDIDEGDK